MPTGTAARELDAPPNWELTERGMSAYGLHAIDNLHVGTDAATGEIICQSLNGTAHELPPRTVDDAFRHLHDALGIPQVPDVVAEALCFECPSGDDPRLAVERALDACDRALRQIENTSEERSRDEDFGLLFNATLRDVVATKPGTPYCALGYGAYRSNRKQGYVENRYARCSRLKCPHCCRYDLLRILRRAFDHVGTGVIYELRLTDAADRRRARGRAAIRDAQGSHFWVRDGLSGGVRVFSARPLTDSDSRRVDAQQAVLDAFLSAPWAVDGGHRYGGLKKAERPRDTDPDERFGKLPDSVSPEDANAICESAAGIPIEWRHELNARGGTFAKRWRATGLAPAAVDNCDRAMKPVLDRAAYEQRERRATYGSTRSLERELRKAAALTPEGSFLRQVFAEDVAAFN